MEYGDFISSEDGFEDAEPWQAIGDICGLIVRQLLAERAASGRESAARGGREAEAPPRTLPGGREGEPAGEEE